MQLIKLYSNKNSFQTVKFNENGISYILAKQKDFDVRNKGKTYNGVGKSLIVRIINFCLGASIKPYKNFCEKLEGWEFFLDFKHEGISYTAKRTTKEPGIIELNNEIYSLSKFNKKLEELLFSIPIDIKFLSYRSLISFFIRPLKSSYVLYNNPKDFGSDYQILLYNSFLLGLDTSLIQNKYQLRKEQDRIRTLENNFSKDSLLKEFFTGNKDVSLTLIDLEEQIRKLDDNLKNFKIANDYYDVQLEADILEKQIFKLNNKLILIKNNIENIENSILIKSDINKSEIEFLYKEVNVYFNNLLSSTLDELEVFHKKLIVNRKKRLVEQKNKLIYEESLIQENVNSLRTKFDNIMQYLGEHQAIDIFIALSNKRSDLKTELDSLKKYQELQLQYKNKNRDINKQFIETTEYTEKYLEEIENELVEIRDYFRALAKTIYPNSASGLLIESNDGENQIRFNIDAKIESDQSDGINNVKIFCYDLTLLFKGHNHKIDFLFHDSRIFDGIDERQKKDMFQIVYEYFSTNKKQYIATINQNQIEDIKKYFQQEEFAKIISDNIILTLTDENEEGKLLGININLD